MRPMRLVAAGLCLVVPFAGTALLLVTRIDPIKALERLATTPLPSGPGGLIVMVTAEIVIAASGILPASLIGIGAGILYGAGEGFVIAALCTFGGALVTFTLTRRNSEGAVRHLFRRTPAFRPLVLCWRATDGVSSAFSACPP